MPPTTAMQLPSTALRMSRSLNWNRGASMSVFSSHGASAFRSGLVYSTPATDTFCTVALAYSPAYCLSERNRSHSTAAGWTLEAALMPRMKVAL